MRKRRSLADKLTIMVCAVLVAVSAFFYAPMDVNAAEISLSGNLQPFFDMNGSLNEIKINVPFGAGFDNDVYYRVYYDYDLTIDTDAPSSLRSVFLKYGNHLSISAQTVKPNEQLSHHLSGSSYIILKGSALNDGYFYLYFRVLSSPSLVPSAFSVDFSHNITGYNVLTGEESASYQNGYNAGYSAGEEAGESNGYSSGYSDGYEAGEQSGYDSGFQAGSDSVDTQSYYDAGYSAGYDVGYASGYEVGYDEGYDAGWSAYEAQMDKWGADTSDYPILVYKKNLSDVSCEMEVVTNMPSVGHGQVNLCNLDISINPSHTYKIVFDSVYPSTSVGDLAGSMNEQFNYNIGLFSIPWSSGESFGFVQGSSLSSVFRLEVYDYSAHYYEIGGENDVFQPWEGYRIYNFDTIDVFVYDMGPSGDTQNHIANQTDQLTNGYDTSSGDSSNSSLSTGLNEFETAENSLFATATTGMKDFTFFDFESVPAMLTAVTFITSIMGSWFEQAGGASGVGIVLSILFSVMLVSMVLGLYRLYQSAGHRAEARERHRERMEQWKRGK